MDRCPVCRARLRGQTSCNRCGADLAQPARTEAEARQLECKAVQQIASGEWSQAMTSAQRAITLHRSDFAEALLLFVRSEPDRDTG